MRERGLLVAAVVVLFAGLGAWAMVADRGRPDEALVLTRPVAPSIGVPMPREDPSRAAAARALELAMLGDVPVLRLFRRGEVSVAGILVPGGEAIGVRDRLRAVAETSAMWPVVVGDGWDVRVHVDASAATVDPPEAIVARARALELEPWIASGGALVRTATGEWSEDVEVERRERFVTVRDREIDLPRAVVAIALLPMSDPSEAPAWLAFGNWSGCPPPTRHVARLMRWRDRFGAELIAIGSDTIELRVARPPSDRESALAIAREHVAYAPSLLEGRTLGQVASAIMGAPVWTFRWPRPDQ